MASFKHEGFLTVEDIRADNWPATIKLSDSIISHELVRRHSRAYHTVFAIQCRPKPLREIKVDLVLFLHLFKRKSP